MSTAHFIGTLLGVAIAGSALTANAADAAPWTLQSAIGDPSALTLSGSFRGRYESLDGQFRPNRGASDQGFALRSTLAAEYRLPWFSINAELIDARVYGVDRDSSVTTSEVNALELVQAHIGRDFGSVLGAGSTLAVKAGRYTLDLGSRRLVARNDFRNTTNAFSGVHVDWRAAAGGHAQLFWTMPLRRLVDDAGGLRDNRLRTDEEDLRLQFWGVQLETPIPDAAASLSLYWLGLDEDDAAGRATRNRKLHTVGGRLLRAPVADRWDVEIEGAYQFGDNRSTTAASANQVDVSAWFAHAQIGRSLAVRWRPRIALALDLASGDKAGSSSDNRFDTLFGARRWEYGPTGIYGAVGRANLRSLDSRLELHPDSRWETLLAWRVLWLDSRSDSFSSTGVRDVDGASGDFAGHQLETRLRWWLLPGRVRIEAGGALLLTGRFLDNAPNAAGHGDSLYGYSMLSTTF